jgi:hypothetical protein
MGFSAIAHDSHRLSVGGARRDGPEIEAGVDEPEEQEEAADGAEDNANNCARGGTTIDAAVGGGDDDGGVLPAEQVSQGIGDCYG